MAKGGARGKLLERYRYYESNKAAIIEDFETVGWTATTFKWKLGQGTLYSLLKRWGHPVRLYPERNMGRPTKQDGAENWLEAMAVVLEDELDSRVTDLLALIRVRELYDEYGCGWEGTSEETLG